MPAAPPYSSRKSLPFSPAQRRRLSNTRNVAICRLHRPYRRRFSDRLIAAVKKDYPVNGTTATVFRLMNDC
jgi:hypothetical protein